MHFLFNLKRTIEEMIEPAKENSSSPIMDGQVSRPIDYTLFFQLAEFHRIREREREKELAEWS